jgi:DNA processing protein
LSKLNIDQLTNLKLLLSVEGIGPGKLRNLLARFRSTEKILNLGIKELTQTDGISTQLAQRLIKKKSEKKSVYSKLCRDLDYLTKTGARIVTIWDEEFPQMLKKIYDPPLLLYYKGNFTDHDNYAVAVVGTRQPTNYGKIQAEAIAGELARQGITIVSGMARGIDSISHRASLINNGRTIAVIGSGLDRIYPPENKKLFDEIAEKGLIISEYEPGTGPDAVNFPKRNRIISGLSLGCILIETGITGGGMQTAALALDQNREVFAVPGCIGIKQSEGTNLLIKKGEARLITNAEDVLLDLALKLKPVIGKNIPRVHQDLNLFEQKIIDSLKNEPLQIDKISLITGISTSDCLVNLLSLEFKGAVKQLPGKVFAIL